MSSPVHNGTNMAQLTAEQHLKIYWFMLLARRLDERSWALHRQGKIVFHVSSIGHEATQVAAALAINGGVDYVYPYYRNLALCLTIGMTATEYMLGQYGKAADPASGGRQMPSHWSDKRYNIVTQSAVVTTQVPHAAGTAFGLKYRMQNGLQDPTDSSLPRLAYCSLGEGSTTQGEWAEGMNWAGLHKLPFICVVENNGYAISVPYEKQAAHSIVKRAESFGVTAVSVDGLDPIAVYEVVKAAAERAHNGEGATCIEARTQRLVPHSSDDDDRTYRSKEELAAIKREDPLPRYRQRLLDEGILTEAIDKQYEARAKAKVNEAQQAAEAAPDADIEAALDPASVFAPTEEVTS